MPPFHLPWCTFLSFVVVGAAFLLAVAWALLDRARERKGSDDPATARAGEGRP